MLAVGFFYVSRMVISDFFFVLFEYSVLENED